VGRVTQLGAPQFDGTQWRQWLEGHGVLELPELATLAAENVEAAIAALTGATPGVTLRSTLSPISIEIEGVGREGLLAAAVTNGALEARVQSLAGLR